MKKRLRQVQLDMTKLRARQAEVTKEVQNSPAVGEPLFLVQFLSISYLVSTRQFVYMNFRSVCVTILMVITILFMDCDAGARPIPFEPQPSQEDINARSVFITNVS